MFYTASTGSLSVQKHIGDWTHVVGLQVAWGCHYASHEKLQITTVTMPETMTWSNNKHFNNVLVSIMQQMFTFGSKNVDGSGQQFFFNFFLIWGTDSESVWVGDIRRAARPAHWRMQPTKTQRYQAGRPDRPSSSSQTLMASWRWRRHRRCPGRHRLHWLRLCRHLRQLWRHRRRRCQRHMPGRPSPGQLATAVPGHSLSVQAGISRNNQSNLNDLSNNLSNNHQIIIVDTGADSELQGEPGRPAGTLT